MPITAASQPLELSPGGGRAGTVNVSRLALQELPQPLYSTAPLSRLRIHWEIGLSRWRAGKEVINGLGISPVLSYPLWRGPDYHSYLEFGVGVAYIDRKLLAERDLSSHLQFEDRIGIGLRFGRGLKHGINLRALHYSNAGLAKPNDGIDIILLSYAFQP